MDEDVIRLARLVSVDFFQMRIVKFFLVLDAVAIAFLLIFQSYLFLQKFEILYFVQYAPAYTMTFYVLACFISIPYTSPIVLKACENMRNVKQTPDPSVLNRIFKEARYVNIFFILYLVLIGVSAVLHIIPNSQDSEMYYFFRIIDIYLPGIAKLVSFFLRSQIPLIALAMMAPFTQLIYISTHTKFHYHIFLHDLQNLEEDIFRSNFNEEIKRRLLSTVIRHNIYQTKNGNVAKKIKYVVFVFFVTSCCLDVSLIFTCIAFKQLFLDYYSRLGTLSLATFLLGTYVLYAGQEVENITGQTFDFLKLCKWYEWDSENQKIYLFFMMNARKSLKFEFSENLAVNYKLGLQIGKFLFSMVSVLEQIKNIH